MHLTSEPLCREVELWKKHPLLYLWPLADDIQEIRNTIFGWIYTDAYDYFEFIKNSDKDISYS